MLRISERAREALLSLLRDKGLSPGIGLRIGLHPAPEGGFRYLFRFGPEHREGDTLVPVGPLTIRLDPRACEALDGVELDFVEDLLNRGFRFRGGEPDPGGCGCSHEVAGGLEV